MDVSSLVSLKPAKFDFGPGDTVRVATRVVEGERQRLQVFQGVVIKLHRGGAGASFTVRKISHGVGVERTFMLHSPLLEKVEMVRRGHVRRARLFYLRGRSGRAARVKERAREAVSEEQ